MKRYENQLIHGPEKRTRAAVPWTVDGPARPAVFLIQRYIFGIFDVLQNCRTDQNLQVCRTLQSVNDLRFVRNTHPMLYPLVDHTLHSLPKKDRPGVYLHTVCGWLQESQERVSLFAQGLSISLPLFRERRRLFSSITLSKNVSPSMWVNNAGAWEIGNCMKKGAKINEEKIPGRDE